MTDLKISSDFFNSVLVAAAIVAADEIGLLDDLNSHASIHSQEFCTDNHIQKYPFEVLLRILSHGKILITIDELIKKGEYFSEIYLTKGYFLWLIKGYPNVIENLSSLLQTDKLTTGNVQRNGIAIAKAGNDYGNRFVNDYFSKCLRKVSPEYVVDLGCGNADRLINIVRDNNIMGIGIDINPDVVRMANITVENTQLSEKIKIICEDITSLKDAPEFAKVDTIVSFFMGHDLFPKGNCLRVFSNLLQVFPNARNLILCDTYSSENTLDIPIFTLGFELTHALMGQEIPTNKDWLEVFRELQWDINETINIEIPYSKIFSLTIRR